MRSRLAARCGVARTFSATNALIVVARMIVGCAPEPAAGPPPRDRAVRRRPGTMAKALAAAVALFTLVSAPARAQQQVLFADDFEHGIAGTWQLDLSWSVVVEGTNHVLSGSGSSWAQLIRGEQLGDIRSFAFRFKLLSGFVQVNYRVNTQRTTRYWVELQAGGLALFRLLPRPGAPGQLDVVELGRATAPVRLGVWQRLDVTGAGTHLAVDLDGIRYLEVDDPGSPVLNGSVAFATLDGAEIAVDDVVLAGEPPSGPAWVATGGPRGGIGYDIRFHPTDPSVLWVTDANAGAHQSVDGGRTWTPRNAGITARTGVSGDSIPIFCLTIDGRAPETIWAGTQGMRGVFQSTDGGARWIEMDQGIANQPNMEFRSFTVDPNDSNVVYCGGNYLADASTARQRGFIYKSVDRGRSWTLLLEPGALVRWILVDPANTSVIYASTGIMDRFALKPEGMLKSSDAGRTWKNINNGLSNLVVGALAMHPTDPKVLIAGTGKTTTFMDDPSELDGAVFKTTDGGEHWRRVYPPTPSTTMFSEPYSESPRASAPRRPRDVRNWSAAASRSPFSRASDSFKS